jgi:hypothetical protein
MDATLCFDLAKNHRLPLTLSHRVLCTAITAYTSAADASSTTPDLRTAFGADRWRTFLSHVSREAATFGFDPRQQGSIAARRWNARAPAWASVATVC